MCRTLRSVLEEYLLSRSLKPASAKTLLFTSNRFEAWIGRPCRVDEITCELLSTWIRDMPTGDRTKIKHRGNMLTLLRYAADQGYCAEPVARKVRRPVKPKPQPQAWGIDELRRVVSAADNLPGVIRRNGTCVAVATYFGCFVRVAYQTGLRRGNLFRLNRSEVTSSGLICTRHEKTGELHVCSIEFDALALWNMLPGERPLQWSDNRSFYRRWRQICEIANVPVGGPQRIRKTAATQVWLEDETNPARVQRFLGHLTSDMWRHYVDRSHGSSRPPKPPAL